MIRGRPRHSASFRRRLGLVLAGLSGLISLGFAAAASAGQIRQIVTNGNMVELKVTVDKAETMTADRDFSQVLVGNPEIADVVTLTSKSIYVLGKKTGTTAISLVGGDQRVLGVINVEVTYDLEGLKKRLQEHVEGAHGDVTVSSVSGKLLLTGTVDDAATLSRVLSLAEQVAPGAITNALYVRGSQQVLLEVRFIEANRDASRDLGVGWDVLGDRIAITTGINGVGPGGVPLIGLASNNIPFGVAIARLLDTGTTADVIVQALEKRGLARRLAEPNLVALSGDTASFLAGGEFPFPVQAEFNKITVEFKKFGVGLAFTPTVLGDGLINVKIEPEVSELDPTNTLNVAGTEIPSLIVRRAQTTVELRDGQSFAIAGLLQSSSLSNERQLPWIGQVPVLGALFRSAAFQKKETDLVIIVTPRLVRPKKPGQKIATPLDGSVPANDVEFFLKGQQEIKANRPVPYAGHILDLGPEEPVSADIKMGGKHGG